ncbi:MAG: class I SAM-dependent methyltransferase, partial [Clostridiales bacterium]|nr:class I SAM-dependent methyltransferase [Clostridiales bacterium]
MIDKQLLKAGAPALGDEALERFDKYAEMLVAKNEQINLTAITEPDEIVRKHFLDSLALL